MYHFLIKSIDFSVLEKNHKKYYMNYGFIYGISSNLTNNSFCFNYWDWNLHPDFGIINGFWVIVIFLYFFIFTNLYS
jgi:hypothetical protein